MRKSILVLGQAISSTQARNSIENLFDVTWLPATNTLSSLSRVEIFSAIWIHFDSRITLDCVMRLNPSALLLSTTTGLSHIENEARRFLGRRLITLQGEREVLEKITSTAELAWSFLLSVATRQVEASMSVREGDWDRQKFLRSKQVSRMKIGILGFGRLGEMSARIGSVLAGSLSIYDNCTAARTRAIDLGFQVVDSEAELISGCDAVLIHANVQKYEPIVTSHTLSNAKRGLILVNTSRGVLVDEEAVLEALSSGLVGHYCADVLEFEDTGSPIENSVVWQEFTRAGNVVLTPHIGGAAIDAIEDVEAFLLNKLIEELGQGTPS